MRIAVLGLALAAAAYVLLVSREVTRPTRDVHRLEAENQILSARLAAEQVAALARAGNTDAKPEIRLVSAADATMRVVSAQGAVLASDRPEEVGRAVASLIGVQAAGSIAVIAALTWGFIRAVTENQAPARVAAVTNAWV